MSKLDKLLKPPEPPERIYNWMHTQMSVARFYGGLTYQGHSYTIVPTEPGAPLVRGDVLRKEAKSKAAKARSEKAIKKAAQGDLL